MTEKTKKPTIIPRRNKQKKRKLPQTDYCVQVIPAKNPVYVDTVEELPKKRVAAYCRVSTEEEAQASSFELQVDYYTKMISERDDWRLVEIYADEGISGTQMKHRENFNRMIEDCKAHKIDMIITKSISRFARNVVDCISTVRMLKMLNPPVSVYFEKERIDSTDEKMEVFLTMMASFAQEESRSISTNISWAIRNRMKDGTQKIPTTSLLGYDSDENYNLVIIEPEAETVRTIFRSLLQGNHPATIADQLNKSGVTTVLGNAWTANSVRNIIRNEKYCGDVLMQKTFTVDYLSHKIKKNSGQREQYFIADHHPGIVSHEEWDQAQARLEELSGKHRKKKMKQQRLIPMRRGLLMGYIPISPNWRTLSHTRLVSATEKVMAEVNFNDAAVIEQIKEREEKNMGILEGFEVIDLKEAKGESVLTVSSASLKFNKATAVELNYPSYIRVFQNAKENKVAIQPCTEKTSNAIPFSKPESEQTYAIVVKLPALMVEFRRYFAFEENGEKQTYTMQGTLYPEDNVIIYDLNQAEKVSSKEKRRGRKTVKETETTNKN